MYNLEDLLGICSMEPDDGDYTNINTLFDALNRHFGNPEELRGLRIKYSRDSDTVRIDYLKELSSR